MISNMKPPKGNLYSLRWFEPKWSYVPRLKTDLWKFLQFSMWLRVLAIVVLITIPSAYEIKRAFPSLEFNWATAIGESFVCFGVYMAFIFVRFWLIPPYIWIHSRGVAFGRGRRSRAAIRSITVDTSDQSRPLLKVETANKLLECGIAPKIAPGELITFLRE